MRLVPLVVVCWQLAWLPAAEEVTSLADTELHSAVGVVSQARTHALSAGGLLSRRVVGNQSAAVNSMSSSDVDKMEVKLQTDVEQSRASKIKTKTDMLASAATKQAIQKEKLDRATTEEAKSLKVKEKADEKSALGGKPASKLAKLPPIGGNPSETVRGAKVSAKRMRDQAIAELKMAAKTGDAKRLEVSDELNAAADSRIEYADQVVVKETAEKKTSQIFAQAAYAKKQIPLLKDQLDEAAAGVKTALHRVTLTGKEKDMEKYLKLKTEATQAHHEIEDMRLHIQRADKLKAREVDKALADTNRDKKDPNIRIRLEVWKQNAAKYKDDIETLQAQSKKAKSPVAASLFRSKARKKEVILAEANKETLTLNSEVKKMDVTDANKQNETALVYLSQAQQDYQDLQLKEKKATALQTQAQGSLQKAELHKAAITQKLKDLGIHLRRTKQQATHATTALTHQLKQVDQSAVKIDGARHNLDVQQQSVKKVEGARAAKLTSTVHSLDTEIDRAERKLSVLKTKASEKPTQQPSKPDSEDDSAGQARLLEEKEKKAASTTEQLMAQQREETENLDLKISAMKKTSQEGDNAESQIKADLSKSKQNQKATDFKQLKSAVKAIKKATAEKMALQISKMTNEYDNSAQDQVDQTKLKFRAKKEAVKTTAAQSSEAAAGSIQEAMNKLEKEHQENILNIRGKIKEKLAQKVDALKQRMLSREEKQIEKAEGGAGKGELKKLTAAAQNGMVKVQSQISKAKAEIRKWELNVLSEQRGDIVTRVQNTIQKLKESRRLTEDPRMKELLTSQIQQVKDGADQKLKVIKSKLHIQSRQKMVDAETTLLTRATQESNSRQLKKQVEQKKKIEDDTHKKERARDRSVDVAAKTVDKTILMEKRREKKVVLDKEKIQKRIIKLAKKKVKEEEERLAVRTAKKVEETIKQQSIFANPNATKVQKNSAKYGYVPNGLSNTSFISAVDAAKELENFNEQVMTKAKEEVNQQFATYDQEADAAITKRKGQIKANVLADAEKKRQSDKNLRTATKDFHRAQKEATKSSDFKLRTTIVDPKRAQKEQVVEDAKIAVEQKEEETKARKMAEKTTQLQRERAVVRQDSQKAENAVTKASMKGDKKSFATASKRLEVAQEQQKELTTMRKKATERAEKVEMTKASDAASVIGVSPTDQAVEKATYAVERAVDAHPVQKKDEIRRAEAAMHDATKHIINAKTQSLKDEYIELQKVSQRHARRAKHSKQKLHEATSKADKVSEEIDTQKALMKETEASIQHRKTALKVATSLGKITKEAAAKGAEHVDRVKDRLAQASKDAKDSEAKFKAIQQRLAAAETDKAPLRGEKRLKVERLEQKIEEEKVKGAVKVAKESKKADKAKHKMDRKNENFLKEKETLVVKIGALEESKITTKDTATINLKIEKLQQELDEVSVQIKTNKQKESDKVDKAHKKTELAKNEEKKKVAQVQQEIRAEAKKTSTESDTSEIKEVELKQISSLQETEKRMMKKKIAAVKLNIAKKVAEIKASYDQDKKEALQHGKSEENKVQEKLSNFLSKAAENSTQKTVDGLDAEVKQKKEQYSLQAEAQERKAETKGTIRNLDNQKEAKVRQANKQSEAEISSTREKSEQKIEDLKKEMADATRSREEAKKVSKGAQAEKLKAQSVALKKDKKLEDQVEKAKEEDNTIIKGKKLQAKLDAALTKKKALQDQAEAVKEKITKKIP